MNQIKNKININDFTPFIFLGIIFYYVDIQTAPVGYYDSCIKENTVKAELLAHHILNMYAQFGFLSNNKYFLYGYIVTPLLVLLHWQTNQNKCILTEDINKKCNIPDNEPFRDIWYLLGLKNIKHYNLIHKSYLIFGWLIALKKLKLISF